MVTVTEQQKEGAPATVTQSSSSISQKILQDWTCFKRLGSEKYTASVTTRTQMQVDIEVYFPTLSFDICADLKHSFAHWVISCCISQ